jgi:hypothetical protein
MKKNLAHTCPNEKKGHLKIEKCSFFSKILNYLYFMMISIEDTIFFYKTIVVQNRMKIFIYFIPFLPRMHIECVTP